MRLQLDLNTVQITVFIHKSVASEMEEYFFFFWLQEDLVSVKRAREEETGGLMDARLRV